MRTVFLIKLHKYPTIGPPKPNDAPIAAKANPALASDIPREVSCTARIGSMYMIAMIASIFIKVAI